MSVQVDHFDVNYVTILPDPKLKSEWHNKRAKLLCWNLDDHYSVEVCGFNRHILLHRSEFKLSLNEIINDEFEVVDEGDFLFAVNALKIGRCTHIYGPKGGLLRLNGMNCVVYRLSGINLYFSVDNYLGTWKLLKSCKSI